MKQHGRFFKVEFTIWIDEKSCVIHTPLHPDGVTDGMAVYEALVVDTEYDGWVLDWQEQEMSLTQIKECSK